MGRERRGRNLRPLPQPMDGSNTAIVQVSQGGTGIEREQQQGLFTKKIPDRFDTARESTRRS